MAEIQNLDKVTEYLSMVINQYAEDPSKDKVTVSVGYTQAYAIYVHEDLTAYHKKGQAKYLEEPARMFTGTLVSQLLLSLKKKMTFGAVLLIIGLRLQRMSQKLVPLDTGALKNSAFTRKDIS